MTQKKKIKIGVDFDGVITYNPLRIARLGVSFFKHKVLKIKGLGFFKPKNKWQRMIYYAGIVVPSLWPARGVELLKKMAGSPKYEFFLLTGRYGFTNKYTRRWLKKNGLEEVFKRMYINEKNEQPHRFKRKIIDREKLDYFIEDNLDIVRDLNAGRARTRILWIYNILDGWRSYHDKYPYLEKALIKIRTDENTN